MGIVVGIHIKSKKPAESEIPFISRRIYGILIVGCFALIFISPFINYSMKTPLQDLNPIYLIISFILGLGICVLISRIRGFSAIAILKNSRAFPSIIIAGTILLLALQAIIVKYCWFKTGWDVNVATSFDLDQDTLNAHFSMYPNQIFLAGLFRRIARVFGFFGFQNSYLCLVAAGCLSVAASVGLSAFIGRRLAGAGAGYLTFIICFFFIGVSPWILVPYSDTYSLLPVTLVLFFYTCVKKPYIKWPAIFLFSIIGYSIKPTAVFVLIAILGYSFIDCVISWHSSRKQSSATDSEKHIARPAITVLCTFVAILLGFQLVAQIKEFGLEIDTERAISPAHLLMMGFNPQTNGAYLQDDVSFTLGFDTKDEGTVQTLAQIPAGGC